MTRGPTTTYFGFDAIACNEVLQTFNFFIPTTSNKGVLLVQYKAVMWSNTTPSVSPGFHAGLFLGRGGDVDACVGATARVH